MLNANVFMSIGERALKTDMSLYRNLLSISYVNTGQPIETPNGSSRESDAAAMRGRQPRNP
jgi:hypothetical protein